MQAADPPEAERTAARLGDHAHVADRHAQSACDRIPHLRGCLCTGPHRDPITLPLGGARVAPDRCIRLAVERHAPVNDDVCHLDASIEVSPDDFGGRTSVPFGSDLWGIRSQRFDRVEGRLEDLVFDIDQFESRFRYLHGLGGNSRYLVADEPDPVVKDATAVVVPAVLPFPRRSVLVRDDAQDPRERLGTSDVDTRDPGVWVRTVKDLPVNHVGDPYVSTEFQTTGDLVHGILEGDRLADDPVVLLLTHWSPPVPAPRRPAARHG